METAIELKTTDSSNNKGNELPRGNYTLIGIDIDTTGRRLIDEIVQLAAYTPESSYSQYIMPLMNLNPAARQRHQVRVITVGFFRMLKSMQTYKVVKTKTEIAALNEFLDWIEGINKKTNDAEESTNGVILIYHEQRKFVPYMMIEAFKKYNLLPRFLSTVKGFANGYKLAEEKCSSTIKYFSIRQLSKVLLNKDDGYTKDSFEGNAKVRAKLAFEIAQHLAKGEQQELSKDETTANVENMTTVLFEHAAPISQEIDELDEQENNLKRQNSLRPVFLQYFRTTLYHRVKAVTFRRVLAENNHDLDSLTTIWTDKKKEGLVETIAGIEELKDQDRTELIEILDCHFDPDKQSLKPVVKRSKRRFPTRFQSHTIVRDNRRAPRKQNRTRSKNNKANNNNNNSNINNNNNNMNQQNHNNSNQMNGGTKMSKKHGNNNNNNNNSHNNSNSNNNRRKSSPGITAGGGNNNKVLTSNL